ncbi:meiosis initiator protein-like [Brienomyrus brachyistius]|uniref:meiosis initiator protein-like n=1 Tax=Brienomyrus brachyistius TaxID=42636 RepID=UPI0020B24C7B|nr:meiosis initiator protein-like [Brienomyrus brachyistius]
MAPRRSRRGDRRKEERDLCASLKEIAAMLPIRGAMLTKKETLAHVLRYLDFLWSHIQKLQAHLPSHCLPKAHGTVRGDSDSGESILSETNAELRPPANCHRAQLKHTCGKPHKPPLNIELWADVQDKQRRHYMLETNESVSEDDDATDIQSVKSGCSDWAERRSVYEEAQPVQDSDSLPSSLDSGFSLSQLVTQTVPHRGQGLEKEAEKHICDHCEAHTGSEEDSFLDSPLSGTEGILLKDHMLGSTTSVHKKHPPTIGSSLEWTSPLALFPVSDTQESLNISPSLLNSPSRGVTSHLLPEGQDYLQALFEDVWVSPKASPAKAPSSPERSLDDPVLQLRNGEELDSQRDDEDSNWSPTQRGPSWKRSTISRWPGSHSRLKKKCINGFIMFCRVNRKVYLRCHPGTPSTVVTKELANLWHIMPKQEKRVYSMKARRFSCQQNRNVKLKGEVEGEEDVVPSPLHTLLAHRDYTAARAMLQRHSHTLSCTENI